MKLWRISQSRNRGWDTYDSAVVAAETEEEARHIHPNGNLFWKTEPLKCGWYYRMVSGENVGFDDISWVLPTDVTVEYLGTTERELPSPVVCSSFNRG
jgi:hypothetical protein